LLVKGGRLPYCTNCGTEIDARWAFCKSCGAQQRGRAATGVPPACADFLHGISDRTASTLCYIPIFGIIPAIIFLATTRFRSHASVRFDAFQSLYLFVAWLIVSSALPSLVLGFGFFQHGPAQLAKLGMIVVYVLLLIRANRGEPTRIPVLGDLAARSAAEQL
jgi:uncharacterized membrane protein